MMKALYKEIGRSIWQTRNRFLSILAIVAIGTGFFAGIKSSCPDMQMTVEKYFTEYNLPDIHLVSTFGFNEDDLAALEQEESLRGIYPAYSADVFANLEGKSNVIVKLLSVPLDGDFDDPSYMNRPVLMEGRMPEKPGECLIEKTIHTPSEYEIGSTVSFRVEETEDVKAEDMLNRTEFTVVGVVQSPSYISFERGSSSIGDGVVDTFVMIPEEDFAYEVYTDVYLSLEETQGVSPFVQEYEDLVEQREEELEALAEVRTLARYQEVVDEAQEKIDDAKDELNDGIETQQKELADARQKIADAQQELADGEQEYLDGQKEFDEKIADAEEELHDAEEKLKDGWEEYNEGHDEYVEGKAAYYEGLEKFEAMRPGIEAQLAAARQQIAEGEAKIQQGRQLVSGIETSVSYNMPIAPELVAGAGAVDEQLAGILSQYNEMLNNLPETPTTPEEIAIVEQFEKLKIGIGTAMDTTEQTLDASQAELDAGKAELAEGEAQLAAVEAELEDAADMLADAKKQLAEGRKQLEDGEQELKDGWEEFYEEKAKGEQELADARQKIADGKKKLAQAQIDYEEGEADSNKEIADAKEKIADAEQELADLSLPKWYVWNRNNNIGYSGFQDDAEKVDAIAAVFPVFFIMVAALVCLTTMTRMVEEERTQIGTMKAMGYGKGAIMAKYLLYAVAASLLGSAIGLTIGFQLFPKVIINTYRMLYIIPDPLTPFRWDYALWCTAAAVACTGVSTFVACRKELQSCPAQLMRPRAPKAGKRVLLERIPLIWNHLSFIHKVTLRNVFRYKRRVLMTVIGIAGCTALMLTGFGVKYAIGAIVPKQYGEIFRYDGIAALDEVTMNEKRMAFAEIEKFDEVTEQLMALQNTVDVTNGKDVKNVNIFVPEKPEELQNYISLQQRVDKTPLTLEEDQVIINEKLSKLMDWKVGDTITMNNTDGRPMEAVISGITENYTFNYVYMTPSLYRTLFRESPDYNVILFHMADLEQKSLLSEELLTVDGILGIAYAADGNAKFQDMVTSLNAIVLLLIVSAGLLAFVVLYNLSNINVNERVRELATIKVLGFYDREVSAYIYRESNISSTIGMLVGLGLGIILEKFVIATAEVDIVMFASEIPLSCFAYAAVLTLVFTQIVNVIIHFKLKQINMVESMKSVE